MASASLTSFVVLNQPPIVFSGTHLEVALARNSISIASVTCMHKLSYVCQAFKGAATKRVYVACVLVFVMHACLCLCRLLQRDQHDDTCLFVFVCDACALVLCRLLHPQCRKEQDIERGMAVKERKGGTIAVRPSSVK
jgi:hypothetical protein